jgi:hypothetical protein
MRRNPLLPLICPAALLLLLGAVSWLRPNPPAATPDDSAQRAMAHAATGAPRFVPNRGQWASEVEFAVLGDSAGWIHRDGFTLRFERRSARPRRHEEGPAVQVGSVVRTRFSGGGARDVVEGKQLPGEFHFLRGEPTAWRQGVPSFASVRLDGVQPGIDVVFRPLPDAAAGPFEYDLVLAPGADLGRFTAKCEGAQGLRIDAEGRLCIRVPLPDGAVELVQRAPIAWQETPAGRRPLPVAFRLVGDDGYGFCAPDHDPAMAAVVDPGVVWSTYLGGGSSDSINDLVWRPGVGLWVAGWAGSTDFPTTTGAYRTTGGQDAFVARLDETGSSLVFGTYLGGGLADEARALDLGPGLQPVVAGFTHSFDFPVTTGALQPAFGGASLVIDIGDAFVARLSATGGALLGATYLGGMFDEIAEGVAVDAAGNACVAGWTTSGNFPTTPGAWQPALGGPLTLQSDGFLAKVAPDCRTAVYSTYVGAQLPDQLLEVAVDAATGDAIAVGWTVSANFPVTGTAYRTSNAGSLDMVAVRLNTTGSAAVFSTYLGGVNEDFANAVTVATDGSVWIGGVANSANFPTTAGAPQRVAGGDDDGVLCRLSGNGSTLLYSTLFGGPGADQVRAIAVDGTTVIAVGETTGGIPLAGGPSQATFGGGGLDGFAAYYTSAGASLDFAGYFGGSGVDVLGTAALGSSGLALLGGWSFSADFPVTVGALQTQLRGTEDGIVLQLDLATDLGDGLEVAGSGGGVQFVGEGDRECLAFVATNRTTRALQLDAVRLLFAGRGAAFANTQAVRVFLDDPALPGERDRLVAGPLSIQVDDAEQNLPLTDVLIPVGGSVTLRVVLDVAPSVGGTIEFAVAAVEPSAWTLRAMGAGSGPAVRVLGSGRVEGPVLVVGALPGDADRDGAISVFDLRRLCARLGEVDPIVDVDGDGLLATNDVDFTRAALLGRSTFVACPLAVQRSDWFVVQGLFPVDGTVEATLGGRSLAIGRLTPRELTLRADGTQATGLQELRLVIDGELVVARTVQVQ